jgi:hypothetical protein
MADFFHESLQDAMAIGGRSSALRPLLWVLAIVMGAVVAASEMDIPVYATGILLSLLCITVTFMLCACGFLLVTNPDGLRTVHFKLYPMAVEKSLVGDNRRGLLPPGEAQKVLEETAVGREGKPL